MCTSRRTGTAAAILLGLVLLMTSGCAAPDSKPPLSRDAQAEALSCFSLGLLAGSNGEDKQALTYFRRAIDLDPSSETLYSPAVATALKLEQNDIARALSDQIVRMYPDSANTRLLQAKVYALSGRSSEAETMFASLFALYPDHPDISVYTARFFLSQEQRERAIETLETALPAQPDNAELLHLLGTLKIDSAKSADTSASLLDGIVLLRKALEVAPNDPMRWQQLGYALLAAEQPDGALEAFRRAHEMMPGDVMLARRILELTILSRPAEEAIGLYEQLAAQTGTDPELWLQYLSEELKDEGKTALIRHLESRLQEPPAPPPSYYAQLSSLYLDEDRYDEAQAILEQALQMYAEDPRMRSVLGFLYVQKNDYENAYAQLSAVHDGPAGSEWSANPFFIFNYLVSAQQCGHLTEAAETMASTYTNNPAVLNRYMHSLLTGESPVSIAQAIELLQVFHTRSPEAAEALYYLMVLQADQKNYSKALTAAEQFQTLANKTGSTNLLSAQFYYQYAALYERTGKLDQAEDLFYKAIDMGDGELEASARNYIAYMWAERGEKLDTGLELILKALESDPENAAFLDTLGWIYYMQGRYKEALTELLRAQKGAADDPVIWEHLGDIYLKLGDRDAAVKHWQKGLEFDPESERLHQRLEDSPISPDASQAPENSPEDTPPRP